jgi:hypothetical protein
MAGSCRSLLILCSVPCISVGLVLRSPSTTDIRMSSPDLSFIFQSVIAAANATCGSLSSSRLRILVVRLRSFVCPAASTAAVRTSRSGSVIAAAIIFDERGERSNPSAASACSRVCVRFASASRVRQDRPRLAVPLLRSRGGRQRRRWSLDLLALRAVRFRRCSLGLARTFLPFGRSILRVRRLIHQATKSGESK